MPSLTQTTTIQLSELTEKIEEALSGVFSYQCFWVIADVSNHTFYPNKLHHYFELIEKEDGGIAILAKAQAVAWRAGAGKIEAFEKTTGQRFKNGLRVCLQVQVEYHAVYGLKLIVQDIDPSFTIGQLELQRRETLIRLTRECADYIKDENGRYRTHNNSLAHGAVIQRIAVVSSSASAGYQDFMHTLVQNSYGFRFTVNSYFTTVQGETNADAACAKIREICETDIAFDAVIIIRGGGADADFLMFDQFSLCAAIARLHIPVITGIGHLKNETIVDLMAHTATKTPTKAAEFIIAHDLAFEQKVLAEQNRIVIKTQQLLHKHTQTVHSANALIARQARVLLTNKKEGQQKTKEKITRECKRNLHQTTIQLTDASHKVTQNPLFLLSRKNDELQHVQQRLSSATNNFLANQQRIINHHETICRLMSPVNILKKGFALVYQDQNIMTSGSTLKEGDKIDIQLLDSRLTTIIQQNKTSNGDEFDL